MGRKRNSPVDCDILYHSTESSSHPDMTLFVCGVCMFSLSVWLFQLPSTVQRHVRLTGDSKWCECDWEWLSLSLLSLWWTDNLSKVHPASCPITAGIDSRPETDKWMRKWMDGYLQKMSQNLDLKKKSHNTYLGFVWINISKDPRKTLNETRLGQIEEKSKPPGIKLWQFPGLDVLIWTVIVPAVPGAFIIDPESNQLCVCWADRVPVQYHAQFFTVFLYLTNSWTSCQ